MAKKTASQENQRLGFYFDQSLCIGCKACQIACKDKHDTPLGTNWRRVVEYSGGDWNLANGVFNHETFTYYTSISCNHCEDLICAKVCPTTAMHKGEDGIVTVDPYKCIGCRYCEWACPYSAPQFNPETKQMSKCDLCADLRAEGRRSPPPSRPGCHVRWTGVRSTRCGRSTAISAPAHPCLIRASPSPTSSFARTAMRRSGIPTTARS